jgi:hypothetical protein
MGRKGVGWAAARSIELPGGDRRWEGGGREREKLEKKNLALYHVGNSNPNQGWE